MQTQHKQSKIMLLFSVKYLDFYLYPGYFCKLKCQGKKGSVSTAFLKSMFQLASCEKQAEAQFLHIVDPVSQTLEDAPFFLCTCCEKVVAYTLASSICYHALRYHFWQSWYKM